MKSWTEKEAEIVSRHMDFPSKTYKVGIVERILWAVIAVLIVVLIVAQINLRG